MSEFNVGRIDGTGSKGDVKSSDTSESARVNKSDIPDDKKISAFGVNIIIPDTPIEKKGETLKRYIKENSDAEQPVLEIKGIGPTNGLAAASLASPLMQETRLENLEKSKHDEF